MFHLEGVVLTNICSNLASCLHFSGKREKGSVECKKGGGDLVTFLFVNLESSFVKFYLTSCYFFLQKVSCSYRSAEARKRRGRGEVDAAESQGS